jgi:hypothetical protein
MMCRLAELLHANDPISRLFADDEGSGAGVFAAMHFSREWHFADINERRDHVCCCSTADMHRGWLVAGLGDPRRPPSRARGRQVFNELDAPAALGQDITECICADGFSNSSNRTNPVAVDNTAGRCAARYCRIESPMGASY